MLGVSKPAQSPSKVVLPLPLGPTMDVEEPVLRLNETLLRTVSDFAPLVNVLDILLQDKMVCDIDTLV